MPSYGHGTVKVCRPITIGRGHLPSRWLNKTGRRCYLTSGWLSKKVWCCYLTSHWLNKTGERCYLTSGWLNKKVWCCYLTSRWLNKMLFDQRLNIWSKGVAICRAALHIGVVHSLICRAGMTQSKRLVLVTWPNEPRDHNKRRVF